MIILHEHAIWGEKNALVNVSVGGLNPYHVWMVLHSSHGGGNEAEVPGFVGC